VLSKIQTSNVHSGLPTGSVDMIGAVVGLNRALGSDGCSEVGVGVGTGVVIYLWAAPAEEMFGSVRVTYCPETTFIPQEAISETEDALAFVGEKLGGEHTGGLKSDIRGRREGQAEKGT